jgi:hypothetical protein
LQYDIDFVLRFETFVDGKQPRRRSNNSATKLLVATNFLEAKESKGSPRQRKLSGDSTLPDDNVTIPETPSLSAETPDHAIDSDGDTLLLCTPSPKTPEVLDNQNPEYVLIKRYPQLFAHDPEDTHYMDYFLTKVKVVLPYFEIFPTMVTDIFTRATTDRGLFHTVLSVSHLIADSRLHRSLLPAFHHQTQALALLQQSISATDITEALATSVAMLAWLNMSQCNRPALSQHLHGLYLIFQEIRSQCQTPSPLLMQIWRFSLRLDFLATTLFFPRVPLFSPVPMNEDHFHRSWILDSTPTERDTEWTLASFALDNLMHRACHISMKAWDLRRNYPQICNAQIYTWTQMLLYEHSQWLTRDIVVQAADQERKFNESPPPPPEDFTPWGSAFVEDPPLRIHDKFYGNLLNAWRGVYIFIDLIMFPEIGPIKFGSKRHRYAVDICRTYASLGKDDMFPIGKVLSVFLAGVALGGKRRSPKEVGWLYDCMIGALQEYFPLNRTAVVCSPPPNALVFESFC